MDPHTTWFSELDMEDPMLVQEFVVECLVDNPGWSEDMERIMNKESSTLSSSGSDCNSSTPKQEAGGGGGGGLKQSISISTTLTPRKRPKRLPEQCHSHIIAERQRRQTLSERFIALSALIPGLKKMDKTSVLGAAIAHMQQLKERIHILEEEKNARKAIESVVVMKQPQINNEPLPEIEARFSSSNVLIKIHCQNQRGLFCKIMSHLENIKLLVTNINAMPFSDTTLDISIMTQMEPNFNLRPQDVIQNLRFIFS